MWRFLFTIVFFRKRKKILTKSFTFWKWKHISTSVWFVLASKTMTDSFENINFFQYILSQHLFLGSVLLPHCRLLKVMGEYIRRIWLFQNRPTKKHFSWRTKQFAVIKISVLRIQITMQTILPAFYCKLCM